jgi:glycosyltransferase involved in cell wall biosynthesis
MASHQTVSFIIATMDGREHLQRTLDSIWTWDGDEVIVVNLHLPPKGWGGRERTVGIAQAKGDYLAFIDDDDFYLPDHRQIMHEAASANSNRYPILFRMRYPSGRILWDEPRLRCGNVGTPMIFIPNIKERMPVWGDERVSDFNWLNSLGPGWEHRRFIWSPSVIVQLGNEDMRWWSYQDVDQPVYSRP